MLGEFVIYDSLADRQTTINQFMIDHKIGVEYSGKSKDEIVKQHIENRKYLEEKDMFNLFLSSG